MTGADGQPTMAEAYVHENMTEADVRGNMSGWTHARR